MAEIVIAVDGPASSGKGTVARAVARALGYAYIDTGALYRTVGLRSAAAGLAVDDAPALAELTRSLTIAFAWDGDLLRVRCDGEDVTTAIRQEAIGLRASGVSRHPGVRDALLDLQRQLADDGGVVMDGRDIGTVVLPDAQLKVFLDADLAERARRRHEELVRRGETISYAEVRDALAQRDDADASREHAPLAAADDAVRIDTTDLTIREVVAQVVGLAMARGAHR